MNDVLSKGNTRILKGEDLKVGSQWVAYDGSIVVIKKLERAGEMGMVWVTYGPPDNDKEYEKDYFSFQCRYSLLQE